MTRKTRTDPERVDRTVEAIKLRREGHSFRQIAAVLGISLGNAHNLVSEAFAGFTEAAADELRNVEIDRLDDALTRIYAVLDSDNWIVQHGKIVRDAEGQPLPDQELKLRAVDRLIRASERRSKLLGLDRPVRTEVSLNGGVDPQDLPIMHLLREAKAKNARTEAELKGEPIPEWTREVLGETA